MTGTYNALAISPKKIVIYDHSLGELGQNELKRWFALANPMLNYQAGELLMQEYKYRISDREP
jgi:hypothetical protein